jgi:hypothetical protein
MGGAYVIGLPFLVVTNMGAVLVMLYLPIGLVVGAAAEEVTALLKSRWGEQTVRLTIGFLCVSGFVASHVRVTAIEPYRYFVTSEDVKAMNWIKANTPTDALFAVNTFFWLPYSPHGTDAGYWIPYFTGRRTTTGTMLDFVDLTEYGTNLVEMSRVAEQLEIDNASMAELQAMGVDYVYIGQMGDFSGPGLGADRLSQAENAEVVYESAGVTILQITLSPEANSHESPLDPTGQG